MRLGVLFGIDIRIHWTFSLLLVWVGWLHLAGGEGLAGAAEGLVLLLAVFGCVVLHELGHALTARRFGVSTRDITLYPIGGVARLERIPDEPVQELLIAIAGPAVNIVIALLLGAVLLVTGPLPEGGLLELSGGLLGDLLVLNGVLALFNLVPAFPMDGGRVLRAGLALRMDRVVATRIAASVGQGLAIGLGFLGLVVNPFLLFIALFVYVGAEQEARAVEARDAMQGVQVRDAMLSRVRTLRADAPLQAAVDELLAAEQQDFPVLDASDRYVGLLTRDALVHALARGDEQPTVGAALGPETPRAEPGEALELAVQRMHAAGAAAIPVFDGDGLVGLLTSQNIIEVMMIRAAQRSARTRAAGV